MPCASPDFSHVESKLKDSSVVQFCSTHGQSCLPWKAVNGAFGILPPQHILSYNLITVMNLPLWILHKSCHCGSCWFSHPSWHFSRAARGFLGRGVSCSQSVTLGSLSISSLGVEEVPMERCQPDASPAAGFKDNLLKYHPCCLEDGDFPGK